ncbi:MAG: HAD hydrolase family protein [Candidatus Hermodarchaeota archaeon]
MKKEKVCMFDLEGPVTILDFAAEIGKLLSKKPELNLQNYDMGEFFFMISNYDDYIIDIPGVKEKLNIPEYQPGDTLRIMAPLYVACFSDEELIELAKSNLGLLPGSKELMKILHKDWDVYVISTSYTQFAHNVTAALSIPKDHVYCTDLHIKDLKKEVSNIEESVNKLVREIFQKYLDNDKVLESVIDDLNSFFWKGEKSDYIRIMDNVQVRGGKRKELAVEDISKKTEVAISNMIALGDSITDINMLQRLKDENGISISFNGNRFSAERANLAITTPNNLGVLPVFEAKDKIEKFLENWESEYKNFENDPRKIKKGLISKLCKNLFVKHNFVPEIVNLKNKSQKQLNDVISRQEKMRKLVRGWAGSLG